MQNVFCAPQGPPPRTRSSMDHPDPGTLKNQRTFAGNRGKGGGSAPPPPPGDAPGTDPAGRPSGRISGSATPRAGDPRAPSGLSLALSKGPRMPPGNETTPHSPGTPRGVPESAVGRPSVALAGSCEFPGCTGLQSGFGLGTMMSVDPSTRLGPASPMTPGFLFPHGGA